MGKALIAALVLALSGCQLGGGAPNAASDIAPPNAIQGPAVEVTTLAPVGAAPPAEPAPKPEPAPAKVVKTPKTADQIACEKRGGSYVGAGTSGLMTCQTPTRDGGKQCRAAGDCDGICLARSRTCAPVKPLMGCNEILQNDGSRAELCIE